VARGRAVGAWAPHAARVSAVLAGQRPGRRAGPDRPAGAGGHGLCPGGRAAPITGLYATIVPLVAYAAFGPSRVMVLGPDSSLAAVIAAVILPLGGDDPETAVALAGALAVLTGLIILVAGVARLGFVTELLSRPVQLGYLCGIAVTILVGQLPRLCGFSIEGRGLLSEIRDFAQGVAGGQVNRAAATSTPPAPPGSTGRSAPPQPRPARPAAGTPAPARPAGRRRRSWRCGGCPGRSPARQGAGAGSRPGPRRRARSAPGRPG
jgi:hypothetical protein